MAKNDPMKARAVCGAKTRSGSPCQRAPLKGKSRCRLHGGAGSGPPSKNANALKHGVYSALLLPGEAEVWDQVATELGNLENLINMSRVKLHRMMRIQNEADNAVLTGEGEEKALMIDQITDGRTKSVSVGDGGGGETTSNAKNIVRVRRDFHAEIRLMIKTIGELEERRAKLLAGEAGLTAEAPTSVHVHVIDARKSPVIEADGE